MPRLLSVIAAGLTVTVCAACASTADPGSSARASTSNSASTGVTPSASGSASGSASASTSESASSAGDAEGVTPAPADGSATITSAAYTSSIPRTISTRNFGMHPTDGAMPTGMVGSVRLWDTGTSWGNLQPTSAAPSWTVLDRAVARARAAGARDFLIVIGLPAKWAAASPKTPSKYFPGLYISPPRSLAEYQLYVKRLATHVNGITGTTWSFEVWNEFDLPDFYAGSASTMASMTAIVDRTVKAVNPTFRTVSPSITVRRGIQTSYGAYLSALSRASGYNGRRWPVDAWSVHPYPKSTGTPTNTVQYIRTFREYLASHGAPSKPTWNTEINYGLPGPSGAPRVDITGVKEPAWLARTYLDAIRTGVDRVYWYAWLPANGYLGIVTYTGTPATGALRTLYGWIGGATFTGCSGSTVHVCRFTKAGKSFRVAYTDGGTSTLTLSAATRTCLVQGTVGGKCTTSKAGALTVTGVPVRLG